MLSARGRAGEGPTPVVSDRRRHQVLDRGVQRVASQQKLYALSHRWRPPDPGDVVAASWDSTHRKLRLDLGGDPRYDEKLIKALGRNRDATPPSIFPPGMG